jgi:hypothetical protein
MSEVQHQKSLGSGMSKPVKCVYYAVTLLRNMARTYVNACCAAVSLSGKAMRR